MAALLGLAQAPLFAHGGIAGAAIEASMALLIVAIALAAWVGGRKDKKREGPDSS